MKKTTAFVVVSVLALAGLSAFADDLRIVYLADDGDDAAVDVGTSEHPYGTLNAALAGLGEAGGKVYVKDGTYVFTEQVNSNCCKISTPVEVVGLSGDPTKVTFTRDKNLLKSCRIFQIANGNAKLKYVTVKDGDFGTKYNGKGGNVQITAAGGTLEDCIISGGNAGASYNTDGGGNIYMMNGRVVRCIVTGGTTSNIRAYGDAIYATGNSVIENSLICRNIGPDHNGDTAGGAVYLKENAQLINCTVANNKRSRNSGVWAADATVKVVNCAIFGNTCSRDDHDEFAAVCTGQKDCFDHCAAELQINDSCIALADPGFTNPSEDDYSLLANSHLIDVGFDYVATDAISKTDLAGEFRVENKIVDIGCYEKVQSLLVVYFDVSPEVAYLPDSPTITFTATTRYLEGEPVFSWDFGDGTVISETTDSVVTHTYEEFGTYTPSILCRSGSRTAVFTNEVPIRVMRHFAYVDPASEHPEFPFATWETAAHNPQEAFDAAGAGMTVVLRANTYEQTAQFVVSNAITVCSETGDPSSVVFKRKSGNTRNLTVDNAGAVICGITLKDGYMSTTNPGNVGGNLYLVNGTVSNCVMSGGTCHNASSGGGSVYLKNGLLTHCKIIDGKLTNRCNGGNGMAIYQAGGRTSNCLITGGATDSSNSKNCTLNYVGVDGGTMDNCTIANVAMRLHVTDRDGVEHLYHDLVLCVGQHAKVYNCAIAGARYYDDENEVPPLLSGTTNNVVNCVFDSGAPVNPTCGFGTPEQLFKGYAAADYRPKSGGPLKNAGCEIQDVPATDLAGGPRIVGKTIDVGCYEGTADGMLPLVR